MQACPSCARANDDDARFCDACGSDLARVCPACATSNAPAARFCKQCRASLAEDPANRVPSPRPESTAPPPPRAAATFAGGRYSVTTFLGEGAKKRVYLAHDARLDRDVAFALIKSDGLDADGLVRIRREAQAMGRLGDHPHIVTVFDTGDEDGVPYIVSQHMAGGSVEDLLAAAEHHRIPVDKAIKIAVQVADALAHAHERGIIHRDLKPGNVWLDSAGNAALGDFGLALALDRSRMTMAGLMVGTVSYMAPEQALGRAPDARSDLYALGAMLYEMLTGRPPFLGDDAVGIISQHINTAPVAPTWHNPDVPRALEALTLRLLAKSPDDRPASASDVAVELRRIAAHASSDSIAAPQPAVAGDLRAMDWGRFVGRHDEMEELKAALEAALSAKLALAFISGEPGIGKTRLAEEFAVYANLRGAQVLTGRCYEGEQTVPYRPFVESLRQYVVTADESELRRQLGSGAGSIAAMVSEIRQHVPDIEQAPALEPEAERLRLFDSIGAFLRNAAETRPIVLYLDDLHWADKPTLLLLLHIARHATASRILMVATYRDVDLDRAHPLSEALATLRGLPAFRRVTLKGLPQACVDELLASIEPSEEAAGGRHALAQALWRETDGNPFFLREILAHLVEEGKLRREAGHWTAGGLSITSLGIPEGVKQVVGARLSRLSGHCNRMLTRASTMTRGFSWDALAAVNSDVPESELIDLLDEALGAQIIAERKTDTPITYDFTHALIRQTLYDELSGPRRVLLHRQVAEALERLWATSIDSHVGELAYHFYHAAPGGDVRRAIDYCMRAGDRATALHGWEDAVAHYQRALQAIELDATADEHARCRALLALGESLSRSGERDRARLHLLEAGSLADRLNDGALLARSGLALGTGLFGREVGRADLDAISVLERALVLIGDTNPPLRARVLSRIALELAFSMDRERAERLGAEAIELATALDEPRALAAALLAYQWIASTADRAEELITIADRVLATAEASSDIDLAYQAGRARMVLLFQLGAMDEASRQLERLDEMARRINQPFAYWATMVTRATFAMCAGNLVEAEQLAGQGLQVGQQAGEPNALIAFSALILNTRVYQARAHELLPALPAMDQQYESLRVFGLVEAFILGETSGDRARVRELCDRAAGKALAEMPRDQLWLLRLGLLSECCFYLDDKSQAAETYTALLPFEGRAVTVEAIACYGSVTISLGKLATVLGKYEDAERHFESAIRLDQRLGPPLYARSLFSYARMLTRRGASGDQERALALLQECLELSEKFGLTKSLNDSLALKLQIQGVAPNQPAGDNGATLAYRSEPGEHPDF